jgi:hypothetical protein
MEVLQDTKKVVRKDGITAMDIAAHHSGPLAYFLFTFISLDDVCGRLPRWPSQLCPSVNPLLVVSSLSSVLCTDAWYFCPIFLRWMAYSIEVS